MTTRESISSILAGLVDSIDDQPDVDDAIAVATDAIMGTITPNLRAEAAEAEAARLREAIKETVATWREEAAEDKTLTDETLLLCAREMELRMEWSLTPPPDTDDAEKLPGNSTDRLRAVAEYIEMHPYRWDQEVWIGIGSDGTQTTDRYGMGVEPISVAGHICGTAACIAGHAVMFASQSEVETLVAECHQSDEYRRRSKMMAAPETRERYKIATEWQYVGAALLGLDPKLADWLFDEEREADDDNNHEEGSFYAGEMSDLLRTLADIPEGSRTLAALEDAWPFGLGLDHFPHG